MGWFDCWQGHRHSKWWTIISCVHFFYGGLPHKKFHECQSGEAVADRILSKLAEWQLQPQLLCGQVYDGAGAMAGKSKLVVSLKYPKAIYTHCAAYRLNLCVMQSADKISRFFNNSPKWQVALEELIDNVLPEENWKKLKELCRTRWVEHHEAFDLFLPTFCCIEALVYCTSLDWNRETHSDAQS